MLVQSARIPQVTFREGIPYIFWFLLRGLDSSSFRSDISRILSEDLLKIPAGTPLGGCHFQGAGETQWDSLLQVLVRHVCICCQHRQPCTGIDVTDTGHCRAVAEIGNRGSGRGKNSGKIRTGNAGNAPS